MDDYLERYIAGESYAACLKTTPSRVPRIMDYKMLSVIPLWEAREEAKVTLARIDQIANKFCSEHEDKEDPAMRELLEDVSFEIMRIFVERELGRKI